jgi:UDP-galactopyranose mutase
MTEMLAGIPVFLNTDYLKCRSDFKHRKQLIFTGPIDEFFSFRLGRLKYRGQKRTRSYFPDKKYVQPCAQVNNPDPGCGSHVRTLEWKHLMPPDFDKERPGTVITKEIPCDVEHPNDYEYPFPDSTNRKLYEAYARAAAQFPGNTDITTWIRRSERRWLSRNVF